MEEAEAQEMRLKEPQPTKRSPTTKAKGCLSQDLHRKRALLEEVCKHAAFPPAESEAGGLHRVCTAGRPRTGRVLPQDGWFSST